MSILCRPPLTDRLWLQRALDPRSPCEPGAGGSEKGHLKFDCALAVLEWTDIGACWVYYHLFHVDVWA